MLRAPEWIAPSTASWPLIPYIQRNPALLRTHSLSVAKATLRRRVEVTLPATATTI